MQNKLQVNNSSSHLLNVSNRQSGLHTALNIYSHYAVEGAMALGQPLVVLSEATSQVAPLTHLGLAPAVKRHLKRAL